MARKTRGASTPVSIAWWEWAREQKTLEHWVRVVIGAHTYGIFYRVGDGSYMNFETREVVVDPTLVNRVGGERLLPCTWRGLRITTLAKLQKVVSRAGARHEGGHVNTGSVCEIVGELHGWLTNVLEDERMERLEGRVRRASRADFLAFARLEALHVLPLLGWTGASHTRVDALLDACLYWRWCSKFRGSFARFPFPHDDDERFWEEEIRPLVEQSWGVKTTQDAADIALEILQRIGLPSQEAMAGHTLTPVSRMGSPSARAPWDRPLSPDDLPAPDADADAPEGGEEEEEEGDRQDGPEGDEDPAEIDVDPSLGVLWARPYRNEAQQVRAHARRTLEKLKAPTPDVEVRLTNRGGRLSARASIRTRGLRPNVLKRDEADTPRGLRVLLLIDHTASMNGYWPPVIDPLTGEPDAEFFNPAYRMVHARRMAMTFEIACTGAGIPLCIGAAGRGLDVVHLPHALNKEVRVSQKDTVIWLRDWWTPAQAEGPKALIAGLYGKGSYERLTSALGESLKKFRELPPDGGAELLLYVHDGMPDEQSPQIRAALDRVRKAGLLVYGVFVGPQEQIHLVEALFGKRWTIGVPNPERLPERVSIIATGLRRRR